MLFPFVINFFFPRLAVLSKMRTSNLCISGDLRDHLMWLVLHCVIWC